MKNLADTEGRLKTKKKGMNQGRTNEWKECRELEKLRAEGRHRKIMMQPSENGAGLGYGVRHRRFITNKDKAEKILQIVRNAIVEAKKRSEAPQQVVQQSSVADELTKIAKLKEQGILSEEEFTKMKQDLINKM